MEESEAVKLEGYDVVNDQWRPVFVDEDGVLYVD